MNVTPPRRARVPMARPGAPRWATRVLAAAGALLLVLASPLPAQQRALRTLTGVVTDAASAAPLPAVQVVARVAGDPTPPLGSTTGPDGRFVIRGVVAGRYEVRFVRLGFTPDTQRVTVAADGAAAVDLGTIALAPIAVRLGAVAVVEAQPAVVHAADRDIYSAEAIAGAAGGAATDVLRGIPDLEVDVDGGVTMYGEAPAIYINGRPAPMTGAALALFLEQFAAENIARVEVMPNPSARFDAEGAGGIVNIVLADDAGLGVSGSAFVNGGTRGQLRGGGRATAQRGALTVNGGASLGLTDDARTSTQLRQNLLADPVTFLRQAGRTDRSSRSGNLDLGATYALGARTELSAEARVDHNVSETERVTRYTALDADREVTGEHDMILLDDGSGTSIDLALELEHEFDRAARDDAPGARADELRVELEYERGGDLARSVVERRILQELGELDYAAELTAVEDRETDAELAIGVDYARAVGKTGGIELGYEGQLGWTDEGRRGRVRLPGSPDDPTGGDRRGFAHRQTVHGGYLTLASSLGALGVQLGARAEHAGVRLALPGDGGVYENGRLGVFPSANLSYAFDDGKRVRLSYSMRVRRPSSNVLNPIDTSNDPLDRRVGNPAVGPQYTHSYMLNASWSGERGYLRATPFVRRSTDEWEQIRTVDDRGVATTTYANLGSTNAYGVSLTASLREVRGIGARVSLNGQHTDRNYAAVLGRTAPSSTRWSVRTDLDGSLGAALAAQGSLTYNPARDLPQGRASSTLMTRVGLRYRFLGRRASLNVTLTDPFDIYDSSIERRDRGYVEIGRERVSMRRLTAGLSYSFQAGGRGRPAGDRRRGR